MVAEMIEDIDWESDEAADWESDEAFAEAEDSAEDIGERARRRRQQRRFRPVRGRQGITVNRPGGGVQRVPFPAPLATAAETNRGLANQEVARRALAQRLNRLETRQKNDSSISGLVTLTIGGGLTAFGAIKAAGQPTGTRLADWAARDSTRTATVVAGAQLATSAAKLVINGRYHRSGIGITADIFSAAQLAAFAFASFHKPEEATGADSVVQADQIKGNVGIGTVIVVRKGGPAFRVVMGANNERLLLPLTPNVTQAQA